MAILRGKQTISEFFSTMGQQEHVTGNVFLNLCVLFFDRRCKAYYACRREQRWPMISYSRDVGPDSLAFGFSLPLCPESRVHGRALCVHFYFIFRMTWQCLRRIGQTTNKMQTNPASSHILQVILYSWKYLAIRCRRPKEGTLFIFAVRFLCFLRKALASYVQGKPKTTSLLWLEAQFTLYFKKTEVSINRQNANIWFDQMPSTMS